MNTLKHKYLPKVNIKMSLTEREPTLFSKRSCVSFIKPNKTTGADSTSNESIAVGLFPSFILLYTTAVIKLLAEYVASKAGQVSLLNYLTSSILPVKSLRDEHISAVSVFHRGNVYQGNVMGVAA